MGKGYFAGIDSGSTSTDVVILDKNRQIVAGIILPTGAGAAIGAERALEEALKEKGLDKEFQLKAVPCSGIEACEVALLKAKRGVLDGNFIEGMACDGGCVQGAGCLVRSPRNRMDVEGHAKQASGRSITDAVAGRELVPQDSLGEKVVPVPKPQPKAEAAAKTEGTARKA